MSSGVNGAAPWMRRGLTRIWSREASLTALLVFLVLTIFILGPFTATIGHARILSDLSFAMVLVAGVFAVARSRWFSWSFAMLAVGSQIFHALVLLHPDRRLAEADAICSLILLGALTPAVIVEVFRDGPITGHRIRGAIAAYMLLGLMWTLVYQIIELELPGAMRLSRPITSTTKLLTEFLYFSFVTLTSTGFGDVTPVHPIARSAAILEALTGQLFPAVLIARLVSLQLADRPPR